MSLRTTRNYEKEERIAYVEEVKTSGETVQGYCQKRGIPETTLRGWLKEDRNMSFGSIEITTTPLPLPKSIKAPTVFVAENIRIELKEGFNKQFLRNIVEVLINAN